MKVNKNNINEKQHFSNATQFIKKKIKSKIIPSSLLLQTYLISTNENQQKHHQ